MDRHPSRLRLLLLTGQALDAATFCLFFLVVPAAVLAVLDTVERNPIVAGLFAIGGMLAVVVAKLGVTAFVLWRDHRRTTERPRVTGTLMFVAGSAGFVGAAFNLAALYGVLQVIAW